VSLIASLAPAASAALAGLEYASTVVVTLAFRATDVEGLGELTGSGFLVPPSEARAVKASTFSFSKWGWVREAGKGALDGEDLVILRTSLGRHRDLLTPDLADDELVSRSLADLAAAVGLTARPVDWHVQRWPHSLPQYAVGHLDRVARIRADVARVPGLAVCGAAYDGIGIAACIASARAAADQVRRM